MQLISKILAYFGQNEKKVLIGISLLLLLIKLVLLPFSATVDADAVSRVLMAEKWLTEDNIIPYGVWAPLHLYLNSFIIFLTQDRVWSPIVINIILSCLTVFPLFYFTKTVFSEKGAIFSTLLFVLSPVVFRNSFLALSSTPYVFLVMLSFYLLATAIKEQKWKFYVLSGLVITLAAGFRYEAWVLIAVMTLISLVNKQWKGTVLFWLSAMIFPLVWMAIGLIYHGDILFGVSGAYHWNVELLGVNENLDVVEKIKRFIFFPMSWFLVCSPFIAVAIIYTVYKNARLKRFTKNQLLWMIPFVLLFGMFIYKSMNGTLLLQHRFSISLLILSVPLFSLFFEGRKFEIKSTFSILALALMIPMSFFWNSFHFYHGIFFSQKLKTAVEEIQLSEFNQTEAFPYFEDDKVYDWKKTISEASHSDDGLILDFVSWSNTYYWALHSGVKEKGIFFHAGTPNEEVRFEVLHEVLTKQPKGLIMLFCMSKHLDYYDISGSCLSLKGYDNLYNLSLIESKDGLSLYRYELCDDCSNSEPDIVSCMDCPEPGTKERIIMEIMYNDVMMASIRMKASLKGVSIDEMIELDAQYILDHQ